MKRDCTVRDVEMFLDSRQWLPYPQRMSYLRQNRQDLLARAVRIQGLAGSLRPEHARDLFKGLVPEGEEELHFEWLQREGEPISAGPHDGI